MGRCPAMGNAIQAQPLKKRSTWFGATPSTRLFGRGFSKESDVAVTWDPEHSHYAARAVLHSRNFGGTELWRILPAEAGCSIRSAATSNGSSTSARTLGGDDETLNAISASGPQNTKGRARRFTASGPACGEMGPDALVVWCRGDTTLCEDSCSGDPSAWGGLCRGTVIAAGIRRTVMAERMAWLQI